jgi:hypothetical protein
LLSAATLQAQQLVFVPVPQAYSLTKHPTLPVLYVGSSFAPELKNLTTFRLDANGKIVTDSRRDWPDWFTVDPKNPDFIYTLWRPSVWAEKGILYLGTSPGYRDKFYARTNHFEVVALGLDAEGQPTRPLRSIRTEVTNMDTLMGIRCDPASRRLYLNYYYRFGWCELDDQGLPDPTRFRLVTGVGHFWDWIWVGRWQRYFSTPGGLGLSAYELDGGNTAQFSQTFYTPDDKAGSGVPKHNLEFSERYRKLYLLRTPAGRELMVCRLTNEGRFASVPRYFDIGPALAIRLDGKAGCLYALSNQWMKTFVLDTEGYPTGTPVVRSFTSGDIRDVVVDESTRTVYVACTQPPQNP